MRSEIEIESSTAAQSHGSVLISETPAQPLTRDDLATAALPGRADYGKTGKDPAPAPTGTEPPAISDCELARNSGLSSRPGKVAELLARYFQGGASRVDMAQLAGELTFAHSQQGAYLLERELLGLNNPTESVLLKFHYWFPPSARAAELALRGAKAPDSLNENERAELYSLRWSAEGTPQNSRLLTQTLDALAQAKTSEAARSIAIVTLARNEVHHHTDGVSTDTDLAILFAVSRNRVQQALRDPDIGLSPKETSRRKELLAVTKAERRFAATRLKRRGVSTLVSIENELHRLGFISSLTDSAQLSSLFGVSGLETLKALCLLPHNDLKYRRSVLNPDEGAPRLDDLVLSVRKEIAAFRSEEKDFLRSDADLAGEFKVQPVAVLHVLRAGLSPSEMQLREHAIRTMAGNDVHRQSVVDYVRQELTAFDMGQIAKLTTEGALADFFQVPASMIGKALAHPERGLDLREKHFHAYILRHQKSDSESYGILRGLRLRPVLNQVCKHLNKAFTVETSTLAPAVPGIRPPGQIHHRGLSFCSYEEAACGLMLERYLQNHQFKLKTGATFQVPVGKYSIDFMIESGANRVFLEYHPIWLKRALQRGAGKYGTYEEFKRVQNSLPDRERLEFAQQLIELLRTQYNQGRQDIVDQHSGQPGTPVQTVTSARELYYFLKIHFNVALPRERTFIGEFYSLKRQLKERYGKRLDPVSVHGV